MELTFTTEPEAEAPKLTQVYDLLIVGGGPAGLTAAVYAARGGLSTAILSQGSSRTAMDPREAKKHAN